MSSLFAMQDWTMLVTFGCTSTYKTVETEFFRETSSDSVTITCKRSRLVILPSLIVTKFTKAETKTQIFFTRLSSVVTAIVICKANIRHFLSVT